MRSLARTTLVMLSVVAASWVLPGAAQAGVPRSCIHPSYDPIECKRDMQRGYLDVLPLARIRALEAQRSELEAIVVPVQDAERNQLLEDILDALQGHQRSN